jgi:mannose-6-phosphate isomerase-like protein (cupin superfamily)
MVLLVVALAVSPLDGQTQRKPAPAARATLAITVSAPDGTPIPDALITVSGPLKRSLRTEGGRAVLEAVPVGDYQLRFDREGYVPLEKHVVARAGKPIDIKVTLAELPAPPPPPKEEAPPARAPLPNAKAMAADLPALTEKEWIGRAPAKTTLVACSDTTNSTLIQLNKPLADHAHADADEVFYVIGGEGYARVGSGQQKLHAGMFLFVPRGLPHELTPSGRNPLILLSVRSGEPCPAADVTRNTGK